MKRRLEHIAAVAGLLLGAVCGVHAQASDTIVANPKAVLLHRIWMVRGGTTGQDRVGEGAGGIGDIDGDSISEFAVRFGKAAQWRVYKGARPAPSTTPIWTLDSAAAAPAYPVVGDFWGTGHKAIGFGIYYPSVQFDQRFFLAIYRTETGAIADTPALIMDPNRTMTPSVIPGIHDMYAADLDGDGADELIAVVYRLFRGNVESSNAEIWIYKGGPNFQVDTPTVIVRDPEANFGDMFYAAIADLDGDHRPDLITSGAYIDFNDGKKPKGKSRIYWGEHGAPWSWNDITSYPSRTDTLGLNISSSQPTFTILDCDGDGVGDLLRSSTEGVVLFRSGAGKNIHVRSLKNDDADQRWPGRITHDHAGYISDSLRHYDAVVVYSQDMQVFNGGRGGPDLAFDAFYSAARDGLTDGNVFGQGGTLADCNGDGWDDYITANPSWFGFDQGIAIVLAGGPYIPRDSATIGVNDVAIAGVSRAISIWPNPARDEVHIAWRGDLHRMPSRFTAHDMLGRLVAEGRVESWRGEAVWQCGNRPSGIYILSIYSDDNSLLATARVIKEAA
ncbi:MAG: T9SS type A sorting domain-containing protein [Bacteroidetes bacterium]|nr:T9SS type A sorting domain-containing protein [Bacteroidota bacterium]